MSDECVKYETLGHRYINVIYITCVSCENNTSYDYNSFKAAYYAPW